MADAIDRQNTELRAAKNFSDQTRRLLNTPVVDDDYPEIRHYYESSLLSLVDALSVNRPEIFGTNTMRHFSEVNLKRCNRWHPKGIKSWSLSDWLTAVVGEIGEAANIIKKLNRIRDGLVGNRGDEVSAEILKEKLSKELADSFIYLDLIAQSHDIDLWAAVRAKFNEVSQRNGFPERL